MILQQIITLKFIGLSLDEIKGLLTRDEVQIPDMLGHQKRVLREKMRQLEQVILAIETAENAIGVSSTVNLEQVIDIIGEVNMSNQTNWLDQFLSKAQQTELVSQAGTLEEQKQVGKAWKQLFEDIQSYLASEPDESTEHSLISRWQSLITAYTQGDNQLQVDLETAYGDLTRQMAVGDLPEDVREWLQNIQDASGFIQQSR